MHSKDMYKLSKENICFVNMFNVKTTTGKELNLKKFAIIAEIYGEKHTIPVWVAIDTDDWKIYMKL